MFGAGEPASNLSRSLMLENSVASRTRPHIATNLLRGRALDLSSFLEVSMPRELIEPHKGDKRYVRRDKQGHFKQSDDVGRSLSQDRKRKAKTVAKKGEGDRGDQKKKKKR
jgi:hypothetical protein